MNYQSWERIRIKAKNLISIFIKYIYLFWNFLKANHDPIEIILIIATIIVAYFLLDATQKQVRVSQQQIDTTWASSKRELKAYIYIIPDQPDSILKTISTVAEAAIKFKRDSTFYYRIKNYGKTPAYNVDSRVFLYVQVNPPRLKDLVEKNAFRFILPPEEEIRHLGNFPPGSTDSGTVWIAGRIKYTDVFKDTTIAFFCYQYIFLHRRFFSETYTEDVKPY